MNEGNDMNPALLDNETLRKDVVPAYYKVMKRWLRLQTKICLENLINISQEVEKPIQTMTFSGLMIVINKANKNFSRVINF